MPDSPTYPAIEMLPPQSLRPNPRNARVHSKRQVRQLAKIIKAAGFIGAIVIDENNVILAGHARCQAAALLDMGLVPTLQVSGLSETQKRAFVLADNKLTEGAGWDRDVLITELGELSDLLPKLNFDISITGFEPAEIDNLFADRTFQPEPEDSLPSPDSLAVTESGDLWILGDHRLLCGNSLRTEDFNRVMNRARARMVFADAPYNVKVANVQGRGRIKHAEFAYASGEMSPRQYVDFLEKALGNAARVSVDGAVHFVCHDWRHVREIAEAGAKVYGAMLNLCVWAKTNAGQGSFYRSAHELIGVFRVGDAGHLNNVELGKHGRNRSNVWNYPGINSFGTGRLEALAAHPTVKPIALVADAIRDCTVKGDVVLDPFVGSGTTILAAEKVGRKAYGLELEAKYVDVTVQRWQAYTKCEATLTDGRTFDDVKTERAEALRLEARHSAEAVVVAPSLRGIGKPKSESPRDKGRSHTARRKHTLTQSRKN